MSTATQISVSEYLANTYRPDREYVDGELLERNLGEQDHSRLQFLFGAYLRPREKEWGIVGLTEQRVQVTPDRYRIPDICARLATEPFEPIVTRPPFLCVEILSKDDTMSRTILRLDDFLKMGVPNVWLVDPLTRRGYRYTSNGLEEAKDGVLRSSNPEIEVPLSELFDEPR
jgi:Uma2 family endonuclease